MFYRGALDTRARGARHTAEPPELGFVGRTAELDAFAEVAAGAHAGHGKLLFIAGEAGVGKSRLAREAVRRLGELGFKKLESRCLSEAPAPYLPLFEAFRSGGLSYVLPAERPPRLEYLYLTNHQGMTMASASRTESPFDRDLFLSMLSAVETFVTDSFSGLQTSSTGAGQPRLHTLGFGEYRIVVLSRPFGNLVAIIRGSENNDLVVALEGALNDLEAQHGPALAAWDGDRSDREQFSGPLERLFTSRRFEGDDFALTPRELMYRTLESLAWGLGQEAERNPVILFLDDIHLADSATISAVQYLARSIREERVLLLATYRPDEALRSSAGNPLARARAELLQDELATEITLGPLDAGSIRAMAEEQLGVGDLDAPLAEAVHRESHGVPLAAIEIVRYLQADGRIEKVGGTVHLLGGFERGRLPLQLRGAVRRRVSRLARDDRDVLECAAVDGDVFSATRVACALGKRRLDVVKALRNLEEDERLVKLKGDTGSFEHARVREVVYGDIHEDLRREYHAAIARCCVEQMERDGSDLDEVAAHHFSKARDPAGATHILRAAEKAVVAASPAEAADWYESYIQLAPDEVTAGVLGAFANALLRAGRYAKAERAYVRLLEHPASEMEQLTYVRHLAEAVANQRGFTEALKVHDDHEPEGGGLTWARWVVPRSRMALRLGEKDRVEVDLGKALPVIEKEGGSVDRADIYAALAAFGRDTGDPDQAVVYGRKAIEAAGESSPSAPEFYHLVGSGLTHRGRYAEAREAVIQGLKAADARSDVFWLAILTVNLGLLEIREGNPMAGRKALMRALRWAERLGTAQLQGRALALLGLAAAEREREVDAAEFFERALPLTDRGEGQRDMALLRIYLARFELERGDPDLAAAHAKDAYRMASVGGDAPEQALALALMAGAAGVSGDAQRAEELFSQSTKGLRFSPSQYEYAEVLRLWADYLLDVGKEKEAVEKYRTAKQVFQELGARGRMRRVSARLALIGPAGAGARRA